MDMNGQLHSPADLLPGKEPPGTDLLGGWVGPNPELGLNLYRRENLKSGIGTNIMPLERRSALGYGLDDMDFESRQGMGIFLFDTASMPALGPTQPLINEYHGLFPCG